MSDSILRHLAFACRKKEGFRKGFTLVELLITMAIVGTLAAIAVPKWTGYVDQQNNNRAIIDINNIESQIERYRAVSGSVPATLAQANIVPPTDPWGNAYIYGNPPTRWDKHNKPLNKDYDLLSMGKDGLTALQLWQTKAFDDIIRCNNGAYIGLASQY